MLNTIKLAFSVLGKRQRLKFIALVIGKSSLGILDLIGVALVGALIASLVARDSKALGMIHSLAGGLDETRWLYVVLAVVAVTFVAKAIAGIAFTTFSSRFLANMQATLGDKVFEMYRDGGLERVLRETPARFQWEVTAGPNTLMVSVLGATLSLTSEFFLMVVILAGLAWVDLSSTLILLAGAILFFVSMQVFQAPQLRATAVELRDSSIAAGNILVDFLVVLREAFASGNESLFTRESSRLRRIVGRQSALQTLLFSLPRYVVEIFTILLIVGIFLLNISKTGSAETLINVSIFVVAGLRIASAVAPFQGAVSQLRVASADAIEMKLPLGEVRERSHSLTQSRVPYEMNLPARAGVSGGVTIEFNEVGYTYPSSPRPVLIECGFRVAAGTRAALIGESGAGKSTVADLALGLRKPVSGEVLIDGIAAWEFRRLYPGSFAYVSQGSSLFAGTILKNVLFREPVSNSEVDLAEQALRSVGLGPLIDTLDKGVYTKVGSLEASLSGGQMQRVCIARALVSKPRLLVLDEATSALDASTESSLINLLKSVRDTTTLFIAHRLSTVVDSDQVLVMRDGAVAASGTFREVLECDAQTRKNAQLLGLSN